MEFGFLQENSKIRLMSLYPKRFGDEERRLMNLVPAPAVKLMKSRVLSRPGMKKCLGWFHRWFPRFSLISSLKSIMFCPLSPFLFRDLSFCIRKLHQIHFVFLLIVLGYQSLFLFSSFSFSLDLISIAWKEFTSHRI